VRSIRPANGLHTRYYDTIIGQTANQDIDAGMALAWSLIKSERVKERKSAD